MKEVTKTKLKHLILTILLLFLTSAGFATNANRNTFPTFTANSIHAISRTALHTKKPRQTCIGFQYEITIIYIPTHHSSQCRRHGITHHCPQGYAYTDEGNVDTIQQPGATTTFTYDPAGRILSQTATDTNGTVIVKDSFTYDPAGNIQHKTETRGDQTWDIDYEYTTDHGNQGQSPAYEYVIPCVYSLFYSQA